jgi:protein TonB
VVIELTVGTDGRVSACRDHRPSPDPEADRDHLPPGHRAFVFRPRLDAAGSRCGNIRWRQRWF